MELMETEAGNLTVRGLYEAHRRLEARMPELLEAFGERIYDAPWGICGVYRGRESDMARGRELLALHPEWLEPYTP